MQLVPIETSLGMGSAFTKIQTGRGDQERCSKTFPWNLAGCCGLSVESSSSF